MEIGKWGKSSQQMQEENMSSVRMQERAWGKVLLVEFLKDPVTSSEMSALPKFTF